MAKDLGWIRLYRSSFNNKLYFLEPFTKWQAWCDLLLLANHKSGFFKIRGIKVEVKRGQTGFSEIELSNRWKWSRGKVNRFLTELKNDSQIVQQKSNVTTLLSIVNYEIYQLDGATNKKTVQQNTQQNTQQNEQQNTQQKNLINDLLSVSNDKDKIKTVQQNTQQNEQQNTQHYGHKQEYKEYKEEYKEGEKSNLVSEMFSAFKKSYPKYPNDKEKDFTACLQIAYKISNIKGWDNRTIFDLKRKDVVFAWEKIILFTTTDKWFSKRSLADLSNEWQRLVQSMNGQLSVNVQEKQINTNVKKESEIDFDKYLIKRK